MKRFILVLVVAAIFAVLAPAANAEKGEVEHLLGVGALFPQGIETYGRSYSQIATLLVGFQTFVGLSDNWDIGVKLDWTYLNNGKIDEFVDPKNQDLKGQFFFDYQRWTVSALARWNWLPGYSVAPHLFFGGGATFDLYNNQTLYTDLAPVNYSNDVKVSWQAQAGMDVQWRFWGPLLAKIEAGYEYSPLSRGMEIMFWFGADWYIKSTNIR